MPYKSRYVKEIPSLSVKPGDIEQAHSEENYFPEANAKFRKLQDRIGVLEATKEAMIVPTHIIVTPAEREQYPIDTAVRHALDKGRIIIIGPDGSVVDIFDPKTGQRYTIGGSEIPYEPLPVLSNDEMIKMFRQVLDLMTEYHDDLVAVVDAGEKKYGDDWWDNLITTREYRFGFFMKERLPGRDWSFRALAANPELVREFFEQEIKRLGGKLTD